MIDAPTMLSGVLIVGLALASWRDLQAREVPDLISLGLIAIGVLGALAHAIAMRDPALLLPSIAGAIVGLAIGTVLYHARQWGGGDAKLLAGVGAVLGLWAPDYRLAAYAVLLAASGAIYGMAWTIWLIARERKAFRAAFAKLVREPRVHRARIILVITGALAIIGAWFAPLPYQLLIGIVLVGAYLMLYGWLVARALESTALVADVAVARLTEGDWLAADVRAKGRVLVRASRTGLTAGEITRLRRAKVRAVRVRSGIPFVPAFLIALIALLALETHGIAMLRP